MRCSSPQSSDDLEPLPPPTMSDTVIVHGEVSRDETAVLTSSWGRGVTRRCECRLAAKPKPSHVPTVLARQDQTVRNKHFEGAAFISWLDSIQWWRRNLGLMDVKRVHLAGTPRKPLPGVHSGVFMELYGPHGLGAVLLLLWSLMRLYQVSLTVVEVRIPPPVFPLTRSSSGIRATCLLSVLWPPSLR